ncbi:MAG: phytanoyl-CoA dioxygenase family protein [Acidimicrobiales bacterium]|nr:phytanoyl-CoA dioxygenase family protein [Acidimicrobiales bacterium]
MQLDDEQREAWRRDGYLVLRGALDEARVAEIAAWVDEVEGWATGGGPGLHHFEQTDGGPTIARSEDLIGHHAGLRALLTEGLLVEVTGQLFGEPALLYKEKVNYKQPGGGGFAPHQDAPAYRFVDHHISVMVPLDPATVASGCLWVAQGHERGLLPMEGLRGLRDDVVAELDWQPVELEPGDLLWFDSYAPHRSDTNTTDRARRALYLTYNAASAGDFRTTYYEDKVAEFDALDGDADRVRLSITDDFLGRPVEAPAS